MTLQQIAERAGVSASTVSRVINAVPGIALETAENVHRAMRAMAYTPTPRRRGGKRTGTSAVAGRKVAFVVLNLTPGQTVPAYDHLLRGVSSASSHFGLDLDVMFVTDPDSAVRRLKGASVDGLILHGTFHPQDQSRPLRHLPTVWLMGNRRRPLWGDQVMPDNTCIGQVAAQYLLRRNHRHVLYFGLRSGWSLDIRQLAFRQAIEDAGAAVTSVAQSLVDFDHMQPVDTGGALRELVEAYARAADKPTALFIAEDWLVRLAYNALREAGVKIGPGGLDVISCNNDKAHLLGVSPQPATIDVRFEAIGFRAVEQLVSRLTEAVSGDRIRMMLEPALVTPPGQ